MTKTAVAIVKPAGRTTRLGGIAWYDTTFRALIDNYFNTGDMTVYDSTLRLLRTTSSTTIDIDKPVDSVQAENIARRYHYIVLRASNYIHEGMDWGHFAEWLEAVKLPVLCLGVGAQSADRRRIDLPPSGIRVWKMIAERCPSIGVRGEYTASVLADNGVHNTEIIGCPTLFRHLNPTASLRHKSFANIRRVAFSLRRETDKSYSKDIRQFLETQKTLILRASREFDFVLTAHGEVEEKIYYYNDIVRLQHAKRVLTENGWFDPENAAELEAIYSLRMFFSPVVSHYDELVRELDFTFGYRVHGVLPALAAGTPSILLRYDTRSAELAETLRVPLIDPEEALKESFDILFHRDRFVEFEANYPIAYQRMRTFLDSHGVSHHMTD